VKQITGMSEYQTFECTVACAVYQPLWSPDNTAGIALVKIYQTIIF